jgi:hypothetical protein
VSRKASRKASRKTGKEKPRRGCVKQTISKYLNRPSPPYPANECCNKEMLGNDGQMYVSKRSSNGVCRWVKV